MKICCFTGHRKIPENELSNLQKRLQKTVKGLLKQGVTTFYAGGALEWGGGAHWFLWFLNRQHLKTAKKRGINEKNTAKSDFDGVFYIFFPLYA